MGLLRSIGGIEAAGSRGGCCGPWRSLERFLIVRAGEQGKMRMDAHFRRYGARMRLISDPGHDGFYGRTIRKHPSAAPAYSIPPCFPLPTPIERSSILIAADGILTFLAIFL